MYVWTVCECVFVCVEQFYIHMYAKMQNYNM